MSKNNVVASMVMQWFPRVFRIKFDAEGKGHKAMFALLALGALPFAAREERSIRPPFYARTS